METIDHKPIHVLLCDTMGLESNNAGLDITTINDILEGRVKDGTKVTMRI